MEAEITHRLELHHFVSHFLGVASVFFHGAPELRGVVALGIIAFEMFAEPLTHIFIPAFTADIAELAHSIDSGSEVTEMVEMLLGQLEMVEQMVLYLFRHIVRPETNLFLRQESFGKELGPFPLPLVPFFLFRSV